METIQIMASDMLLNLALGVLSLLAAYALYFIRVGTAKLKAQTAKLQDEAARALLDNALDDVASLANLSVSAMEQTTAKALREAVREQNAEREDLVALGEQVFRDVKLSIAPEAQQLITQNLGSFDAYLSKCIEDAVLHVKQLTDAPMLALPE